MAKKSPKTSSRNRKTPKVVPPGAPKEVTRHISKPVTAMLWGRAAGRCEFAGCNRPLWKSTVTQEEVNVAQQAHIYSFSPSGPRGNEGVDASVLNSVENLMLVCHQCHRKIDARADGGRYTVAVLQAMKREHERRVELVTDIAADRRSHVLLYGANIGVQSSPLNFSDAAHAMFPGHYPASDRPIELGLLNSATTDGEDDYWDGESRQLRTLFERQVHERVAAGDVDHLSIFSLAPQPLLILLGTLLGDIVPAAVYQRHREPATWAWPATADEVPFNVTEPANTNGQPALVLGVSATITADRIAAALGSEPSIWAVTVPEPHNDVIKSGRQLADFRATVRPLLDRIKAAHGQNVTLHIFPAAPVSLAVELGRIRMPKADMSWLIYDQSNARGGFIRALSISP
jgi:hypothetical protein